MTHSPHASFSNSFAKHVLIYLVLFVGLVLGALNAVGAFGYGHEQARGDQTTISKKEKIVEKPVSLKEPAPETSKLAVTTIEPVAKSQSNKDEFTSADFFNKATKSFVPVSEMSNIKTYLDVISAKKISLNPASAPLTGAGITIGIVDSGINVNHEELKNLKNTSRLISQACSGNDDSVSLCDLNNAANIECDELVIGCYHGTAVADLAAGKRYKIDIANRTNTFTGGVAPDANVSFSRVTLNKKGELNELVLRDGLQKFLNAVNSNSASAPDVVNISIGFARDGKYADCNVNSEITNVINALVARNITVVASSGNSGDKNQIMYPACLSNVIAVGASEYDVANNTISDEKIAGYSQSASELDVVAPGSNLLASLPTSGKYSYMDGTSFATPIVSGAVALLKQANPSLSPAQIRNLLVEGSDQVKDPANGETYSRINVLNSLKLITSNATNLN